jgi:hypothetical protein
MKPFFFKDTFKKIAGILISIPGILLLVIAIYGLVTGLDTGDKEDINMGLIIGGLSVLIIIPGIRLYISGRKLTRLENKLNQLTAIIKSYRRISLSDIAKKFNTTETEAERLLTTAINHNMINGNMDRTTGEFYVADSVNEIKRISFCPNCGASINQVIYNGETGKCSACGSLFR